MRKFIVVMLTLVLSGVSQTAGAQTSAELAAMEARLMARLERRIAEEGTETKGQIDALRISFKQAVEALAKSSNDLDRKALVAIDKGATKDGLAVLEERATGRAVGHAQVWEMDPYSQRWNEQAVGVLGFDVAEGYRRQGLARLSRGGKSSP